MSHTFTKPTHIGYLLCAVGLITVGLGTLGYLQSSWEEIQKQLNTNIFFLGLLLLLTSLTILVNNKFRERFRRLEAYSRWSRSKQENLANELEGELQDAQVDISYISDSMAKTRFSDPRYGHVDPMIASPIEVPTEVENLVTRKLEMILVAERKSHLLRTFQIANELKTCAGLFTRNELAQISDSVSNFNALHVAWVYSSNDSIDVLALSEKRRLCSYARTLGYWGLSLSILDSILKDTNSLRDESALRQRASELKVYSGISSPSCQTNTDGYVPDKGQILHVVGKSIPSTQSGYTLRTHYSARALSKAGYRVSVVALIGETGSGPKWDFKYVDNIQYFSLSGEPRSKWILEEWLQANVDRVAELVQRIRPALLHAHSDFLNAMVANIVGKQFGIPVVYETRGFWEESWISRTAQTFEIVNWLDLGKHYGLPDAYALRQQMEISMRGAADHVITLAQVMKDHIITLDGPGKSIAIVPNAVSADNFPVVKRDRALAIRMAIPKGVPVIGYISSIVEYEGIDTLIRAFDLLAETALSEAHLVIVGDGAQLPVLKELARELGVPRVHFTGRVSHDTILSYYSLIDIFVIPRRPVDVCHLVTPLKPFEAFSTGKAVIMSDVKALQEIADDSGSARTFTAGDHISLAAVIVDLVNNPAERELLGQSAASWVRKNRSWDSNAESYAGVYEVLGVKKVG